MRRMFESRNLTEPELREAYFNRMYRLVEKYVDRSDLKDWNETQKDLWLALVHRDEVEQNDVQTFFAFGKFFADYVEEHGGEAPDLKDVLIQFNPRFYR